MKSYNRVERYTARILGKFPHIKERVKYIYQYINYNLYKERRNCHVNDEISLKRYALESNGSFWGYYDKSPICCGQVLYHSFNDTMAQRWPMSNIDIVLNDKVCSSTRTWNWQQGSMLSWMGDDGLSFIHNDFDGHKYVSKIVNAKNLQCTTIDYPIYKVSHNGTFALSLNFARLAKLRPDYGYFNIDCSGIEKMDKNDGIFYVDLENNTQKLIVSFQDLLKLFPKPCMEDAWHKVNHIDIAPDNKRFMFLHRWFDNKRRKFSRLITANIDGSDLCVLADEDMVSHCAWKNSSEIIAWARKHNAGDRYYLFKDKTEHFQTVGGDILLEDGHPQLSPDEKWLLTDTYPDRARRASLLLYQLETAKKFILGTFLSPMCYHQESRCDLHPRWNPDGKGITFDSIHTGRRHLYEMDISRIVD
ncbi:MAG: hypothetical protein KAS96_09115 [Planctomycetes bacterium]|nr:hypothetical protein [Planctomycetota bacterium]